MTLDAVGLGHSTQFVVSTLKREYGDGIPDYVEGQQQTQTYDDATLHAGRPASVRSNRAWGLPQALGKSHLLIPSLRNMS
jgi:hypothetical protein